MVLREPSVSFRLVVSTSVVIIDPNLLSVSVVIVSLFVKSHFFDQLFSQFGRVLLVKHIFFEIISPQLHLLVMVQPSHNAESKEYYSNDLSPIHILVVKELCTHQSELQVQPNCHKDARDNFVFELVPVCFGIE